MNVKAEVEIDITGKKLKLTMDDVRELRDLLDTLLGEQRIVVQPVYPHYPNNPPWDKSNVPYTPYPQVTWS